MDTSMADNTLICNVCGNSNFEVTEGFYYCNECGTQIQEMRDVEIEQMFPEEKLISKTIVLKKTEIGKNALTSWECFNYLLRGLVEELVNLGANDKLKTVALQLWSTYLRKTEVAFFDKKKPQLPKLGARYSERDAQILYNHKIKKKKRKRKADAASATGKKLWRKQKKKFTESEYTNTSLSTSNAMTHSSVSSTSISRITSGSGTTSRAIRLTFTRNARRNFKRIIPKAHLIKHEADSEKDLECHNLKIAARVKLKQQETWPELKRKTVYTILYLALNLTNDGIQLCDMLRFMREGHLSSSKLTHLFPEDIAKTCQEIINSHNFCSRRVFFLDNVIRMHAAFLSQLIHIPYLNTPNIHTLATRFLTDLCLPQNISKYIEHLINLCPPQMRHRFENKTTPCYEGRAMAYIVFVLKLLFGIDDCKELKISESARIVNNELQLLGSVKRKLFVWSDWQKYIELRNIILSQCHLPTSRASKTIFDRGDLIDELKNDFKVTEEEDKTHKHGKAINMEQIFESLLGNLETSNPSKVPPLKFDPSLTPNFSYFEEILQSPPDNVIIPLVMQENHADSDVGPFVKASALKKFLKQNLIRLNVEKLACNDNRNYVGLFKNFDELARRREYKLIRARKFDFDIDETEWLERVHSTARKEETITKVSTRIAGCKPVTIGNSTFKAPNLKRSQLTSNNETMDIEEDFDESLSMRSFNVFDENNMKPLDQFIEGPRRHLEDDEIFANVSGNESENDDLEDSTSYIKTISLHASCFDYWTLFGKMSNINNSQFRDVQNQFPRNFLWLLEICSSSIGIDVRQLYDEVLTIENYFINVLAPIENVKNMLSFRKEKATRDLASVTKYYQTFF